MINEQLNELLLKTITALKATEDALLSNKVKALELEIELIKLREALPQWISVKDRLPKFNKTVLLFDSITETTCLGQLVNINNIDKQWTVMTHYGGPVYYDRGTGFERVTHWMPLPEPPEVEND